MSAPAIRSFLYNEFLAIGDAALNVYRTPEKLETTADMAMIRTMQSFERRLSQESKEVTHTVSVLVMLEDAEAEDAVDRMDAIVQEIVVACRNAPRNALVTGPDGEVSKVLFCGERIVRRPAQEADMGPGAGDEGMFLAAQVLDIDVVEQVLG